ncbi:MAG: HupE/UreJ family protein [Methylophilaceae bacterium]
MKKQTLLGLVLAGTSTLAMAHPGHGLESTYAGFMHPFSGWDHLLVMLAVGLWAGKLGGHARWQLPLTFMLVMALGSLLGFAGLSFAGVETAIAATVMAMGLLLVISLPIKPALRIGLVGLFAFMHGLAHGAELSQHSGLQVISGMLLATGLLHAVGVALGAQRFRIAQSIHTMMGWLIMLAGGYLLVT